MRRDPANPRSRWRHQINPDGSYAPRRLRDLFRSEPPYEWLTKEERAKVDELVHALRFTSTDGPWRLRSASSEKEVLQERRKQAILHLWPEGAAGAWSSASASEISAMNRAISGSVPEMNRWVDSGGLDPRRR